MISTCFNFKLIKSFKTCFKPSTLGLLKFKICFKELIKFGITFELQGVENDPKRRFMTRKRMTCFTHYVAYSVEVVDRFSPSG